MILFNGAGINPVPTQSVITGRIFGLLNTPHFHLFHFLCLPKENEAKNRATTTVGAIRESPLHNL